MTFWVRRVMAATPAPAITPEPITLTVDQRLVAVWCAAHRIRYEPRFSELCPGLNGPRLIQIARRLSFMRWMARQGRMTEARP